MDQTQRDVFQNEYMPYIIKWGKILSWASIPLIFIPSLALAIFYGARPTMAGIVTGLISLVSAMIAWYVVDPVTLYPILHIPGMYLTYIGGNSKEIRAPATIAALSAAEVDAGTEHGTVIAAIAISVSLFISIAVMTLVAIAGNVILSLMPPFVLTALGYLLPALFGAMMMTRVMMDYKTALIVIPLAFILRRMSLAGVFKALPFGGGYAQILASVFVGVLAARFVHAKTVSPKAVPPTAG